MLREAGARRGALPRVVAAVPVAVLLRHGHRAPLELLAADMSVGEIRDYLGVDSLAYLELDRLTTATGAPPESFCTACLSGDLPGSRTPDRLKHVLKSK